MEIANVKPIIWYLVSDSLKNKAPWPWIKQLMHLIKYMNNKVINTLTKKNEEVINTYVAGRTLTKNSTKLRV